MNDDSNAAPSGDAQQEDWDKIDAAIAAMEQRAEHIAEAGKMVQEATVKQDFKVATLPEAPDAARKQILLLVAVAKAAQTYFAGYVQDEAADGASLQVTGDGAGHYTGCSNQQAIDALALRTALEGLAP